MRDSTPCASASTRFGPRSTPRITGRAATPSKTFFESIRLASRAGLRVSLNLLTHPGVTDERAEIDAMEQFLAGTRVDMVQTRTLNVDPEIYFAAVGRPAEPLGMRLALERLRAHGVRVGNFTHTH